MSSRPKSLTLITTIGNVQVFENWGGQYFHYTIWKDKGKGNTDGNNEACLHIYEDSNLSSGKFEELVISMARAIEG